MTKISLVIITLNEQDKIGRCIDSAHGIADEVVVVDSLSADKTQELAIAAGARVIERPFTNYIEQKNFAMEQAAHDYVLNLDADEFLSETLRKAILQVKAQGLKAGAYAMNRLNYLGSRPVKTCGWYPDRKIRLWNRKKGRWTGELVHELLVLEQGSNIQHLEGDILHHSFETRAQLTQQWDKFATLAARQLQSKSAFLLFIKMLFNPLIRFIRNYFLRLGFTDGGLGLFICTQQGREVFLKYKRALGFKLKG